jgi:chromosome segregation ATPase
MGFFTVGNLLTLGIVLVALILYRSMDRRSRMINNMKKHADKLKDELTSYVETREQGIKNLGIDIRVEQEAAKEIMNRIQTANDALAEKAAAADRVEERLNAYDSTLEELVDMTARVQENLTRIQEESAFIDGANKRISEAKSSLQGLERGLESLEIRFERDNAESLQNLTDEIMAAVRAAVSDLTVKAETIERKVEEQGTVIISTITEHQEFINNKITEHREAVDSMEQSRAKAMARDMNIVDKTLQDAVEQAGISAEKIEETTMSKLKAQAEGIVSDVRSTVSDLNVEAETAERKVEEHREFISNKIAEQLDDIDNRITEHLETIDNKVIEHRDFIDNKITEHRGAIDSKITEHREAVDSMEQSRAEAMARDMDLVDRTLKGAVAQAGTSAEKIEEATMFKLKAQGEQIVSDVRSVVSDLNLEAQATEQRVGEHREFIDRKITEHLDDIDNRITGHLETIDNKIAEHSEAIDNKITEHQDFIDNKITEHREAVDNVEQNRAEAMARDMDFVDKTLKGAVAQAGTSAERIEEATLLKLKAQAEEIVSDVRSVVSDLNVEAQAAERKVGEHREMINKKITEHLEDIDSKITGHLETIDNKITEHSEAIENKITEHSEAIDSKITKHRDLVDSKITEHQDFVDSKISEHREAVDSMEQSRAKAMARDMDLVDKTLKGAVAQAGTSAEKIEEATMFKLKAQGEQIVSDVRSVVSDLNVEAQAAERKVGEHREFINNKIAEHLDDIDNRITGHLETIDNKIAEHSGAIDNKISEHSGAIDSKIAEHGAFVDNKIAKHLETIDSKVSEHRDFVDSKITEHLETIDNKVTEHGDFVDSKISEHREAVDSMEQSRAEAMARDINIVDKTLKDAVEQAGTSAEKIEETTVFNLKAQAEQIVSDVRSVVSELNAEAETAERKVGEHRKFIDNKIAEHLEDIDNKITEHRDLVDGKIAEHREAVGSMEQSRAEAMARDMALVNKTLKNAVEQAGIRADKMEEAALVKLKEQAKDRIEKLKLAEEEKIRTYQENARSRVAEVQNIVKNFKDEWREERLDLETKEKAFKEESKKDIEDLKNLAAETEKQISQEREAQKESLEELKVLFGTTISSQEKLLTEAAEQMKLKALETTGAKLDEYRQVQDSEFQRLEALAEDSQKLDAELRRYMQETVNKVKGEFSVFTGDSARERQKVADDFNAAAQAIRTEMDEIEQGIGRLKASAYQNVSENIKIFEDEFFSDLAKRSEEMSRRISVWKDDLENKLVQLGENEEEKRSVMEQKMTTEIRQELSARNDRIVSELERLKSDAGAFEEGIREQMSAADITLASYKNELDRNLEDTRESADAAIKTEIANMTLSAADKVKQNQRELEGKLKEAQEYVDNRTKEIQELLDISRRNITEQEGRIVSVRSAMDDIRKDADSRRDEILSRFDEQAKSLESGIHDAERQIKDFFDQAKLIDRTDELKKEMERGIEDLRSDLDRLEQRRAEAAQLESQFAKVRRLEDDVNAKMSRFLSEQHRIEQMDAEFTRLVQTSKAVEEKLKEVTASDDILQHIQLQIRKMGEGLAETEEKFQRIEKKNQILETTNDGIDRNFKELQESEKTLEKVDADLDRITDDVSSLKQSIENLATQSEKAHEAVNQMTLLDTTLSGIEERITSMQTARAWIARTETRLEELNREILENLRLVDTAQRDKGKKKTAGYDDTPSPPINVQESVVKLATKGWKVEEIAKTLKLARSEVELILEISPKE